MSLIKLCANRMTKELMAGNLKESDINSISNFNNNNQNIIHFRINKRAKLIQPNMLRSDGQIISGLHRGTEAIAKKMNLDSYDLNNYSSAPDYVKSTLDFKGKHNGPIWEQSVSYPEMNVNGKTQKAFIAYDKTGKTLEAAIGGRHELFEDQERLRIGKKVKVSGGFFPTVTETATGNSNGRISYKHNGSIYTSGNHNTLGVLGKESTEVSRLFNYNKTKLYKLRTDNYNGRTEAKLLEGITGKKYGTKYGKKEFKILDQIKSNERFQTSFLTPPQDFTDFDDAIKQGEKLRKQPKPKFNFNIKKALKVGVPLGLMGGALAYGMHKYLKSRSNKRPAA